MRRISTKGLTTAIQRLFLRMFLFAWAAAIGLPPVGARGEELTVAAAANLNFAFKELASEFEKGSGIRVRLSFGSSGNFYSQIQQGAPFDLFFSADMEFPKKLEESGHAVPRTLSRYAIGRLVLWVPNRSGVAVEKLGMQALLDSSINKIAIANPKHAPYGRAAVAAMQHFNLYDRVKDKLVLGENISQTMQFVESGAADIGFVALPLVRAPTTEKTGRYWEVPAAAHPALEQGAVVLKNAKNPSGARAFLDFLRSPPGEEILRRYGYTLD